MPEEGFLRRWARVKASPPAAVPSAPPAAAPPAAAALAPPSAAHPAAAAAETAHPYAPTLDEASQLTPASDFSAFVSQGVDKDVRRLALKKLFADPHFNVMDRLDMYMDDYNKPSPVSAAMLAALQHARSVLRTPEEVQTELARLAALDYGEHAAGVVRTAPAPAQAAVAADEAAPGMDQAAEPDVAEPGAGEPASPEPDAAEPASAEPAPDRQLEPAHLPGGELPLIDDATRPAALPSSLHTQ